MTDLERIKGWLLGYSETDRLQSFRVDYLKPDPDSGSIRPSGLTEISRTEDVLGNVVAENQLNFGLYYVLAKSADDETGAQANAQWVLGLQQWVQQQSVLHLAPTFGDEPKKERMIAHNGALYAEQEDGTATYLVQLSANFTKYYEVI